ncbi:MAG: oxidoreductase [Herbaspirillum sp.]|nr:oxidoreductase [Herbaspirillum sp.]
MGGVYCENCDIAPLRDIDGTGEGNNVTPRADPVPQGVMPYAVDPAAADRLWSLSERLLGLEQYPQG